MTAPNKKFFVKATGDNRYAAGTSKWLRIKDIKFNTEEERSEIKVRFQGDDRYVDVYDYESNPANLKFAMGSAKGMPVSWSQVKEAFKQINESKKDKKPKSISKKLSKYIGDSIGIDWDKIDLEQFHMGVNVELEHGSELGEKTNVTKDDLVATGKIALAHLLELPDYYTRLAKMETNENSLNESYSLEALLEFIGPLKPLK